MENKTKRVNIYINIYLFCKTTSDDETNIYMSCREYLNVKMQITLNILLSLFMILVKMFGRKKKKEMTVEISNSLCKYFSIVSRNFEVSGVASYQLSQCSYFNGLSVQTLLIHITRFLRLIT